jgi:general stress protein 26
MDVRDTTPEEDLDKVWSLMERIHVCMLVTMEGDVHRARPMGPRVHRNDNAIYFLTDDQSPKIEAIAAQPSVCLTFADPGGNDYVSLSGTARILNDRHVIRELWSPAASAFWDSVDDPRIRALEVTPSEAQYWLGPNALAATVMVIAAAATGAKPKDLGKNAKVEIN